MIRLVTTLLTLISATSQCLATMHYLDCQVGSSGNGASWATAWKAISNITGLSAGDTVYISGSVACSTYSVAQWIITGGTGGNPITYQVGQDAGHTSFVTITLTGSPGLTGSGNVLGWSTISGNLGGSVNMELDGLLGASGSVAINGLHLTYLSMNNTTIEGTTVQNFTLDHNTATVPAGNDHFFTSGASAGNIGYTVNSIHDNVIQLYQTNDGSGHGTDGFQWLENVSFYNNTLVTLFDATSNSQHQDGVQTAGDYVAIYNNYFENFGNYPVYGDLFGNASHWHVYNNVMAEFSGHGSNISAYGVGIGFETSNCCTMDDFIVSNNTIDFANGLNCVGMNPGNTGNKATNSYIVNNLCYNTGIVSVPGTGGSITVSSNYSGTANISFVNAAPYPSANFQLLAASTNAIGQGINPSYLTSIYTTDKNGNPRGSTWDLGAYQYNVTGGSTSLGASVQLGNTVRN